MHIPLHDLQALRRGLLEQAFTAVDVVSAAYAALEASADPA